MGRSSRLSDWLEGHGFTRPPMQRMGIKLNYATAMFRRDPAMGDTWGSIAVTDAKAACRASAASTRSKATGGWS